MDWILFGKHHTFLHNRQAMLAEKLGYHLARGLQHRASLSTSRCNHIEVKAATKLAISTTRLSLAIGISRHEAFIFEVELNAPPLAGGAQTVWAYGDDPLSYSPLGAGS
jgi:hypothetical protein